MGMPGNHATMDAFRESKVLLRVLLMTVDAVYDCTEGCKEERIINRTYHKDLPDNPCIVFFGMNY